MPCSAHLLQFTFKLEEKSGLVRLEVLAALFVLADSRGEYGKLGGLGVGRSCGRWFTRLCTRLGMRIYARGESTAASETGLFASNAEMIFLRAL